MIAEVGDMAKVSGSRIATPLAPPRPGSTPISMPRNEADQHVEDVHGSASTPKPWTASQRFHGRYPWRVPALAVPDGR